MYWYYIGGLSLIIVLSLITLFFVFRFFYKLLIVGGYYEKFTKKDGLIFKNVVYDSSKNLTFDLLVPTKYKQNKEKALILFIHGGGWSSGNKNDIHYLNYRYTKEGYITASINYSLSFIDNDFSFYDMLDDIDKAIYEIDVFLKEQNLEVKQMAISGVSAGAHLAMLYYYKNRFQLYIPIKFIFQWVGPVDFHYDCWETVFDIDTYLKFINIATNSSFSEKSLQTIAFDEKINDISPIYYITGESIPILSAYGEKDTLVTSQHHIRLKEALDELNVKNDIVIFKKSNHGLYNDKKSFQYFKQLSFQYCEDYFK